jgi:hypothetical protein
MEGLLIFALWIIVSIAVSAATKKRRQEAARRREQQQPRQQQPRRPRPQPAPTEAEAPPIESLSGLFGEVAKAFAQTRDAQPAPRKKSVSEPQGRRSTRIEQSAGQGSPETPKRQTRMERDAAKAVDLSRVRARPAEAPMPQARSRGRSTRRRTSIVARRRPRDLRRMIVWSEILGKPVSLRDET